MCKVVGFCGVNLVVVEVVVSRCSSIVVSDEVVGWIGLGSGSMSWK